MNMNMSLNQGLQTLGVLRTVTSVVFAFQWFGPVARATTLSNHTGYLCQYNKQIFSVYDGIKALVNQTRPVDEAQGCVAGVGVDMGPGRVDH